MSSVHHDVHPVDPTDAAHWPAWTDNWHWEISDPCEVAELRRLALEAEIDRRDAPDVPLNQISPDELAMAAAGLALG
jgi:hypothetical protein